MFVASTVRYTLQRIKNIRINNKKDPGNAILAILSTLLAFCAGSCSLYLQLLICNDTETSQKLRTLLDHREGKGHIKVERQGNREIETHMQI